MPSLKDVADAVLRRAQRQGYIVPREIRAELKLAGLAESQWKEVVALAKGGLNYRQGRYHAVVAVSPGLQAQREQQRRIERAVRQVIKANKEASREHERRGQPRFNLVQPVRVDLGEGKSVTLLTRDISITGIRLVGTRQLLGHKIRVHLPQKSGAACQVVVRVLWTCALGEDMFENGGSFLEVVD